MQFTFGNSSYRDSQELIDSLQNYFSKDGHLANHLKSDNLEEQFRFAYFHQREDVVKFALQEEFGVEFIDNLENSDLIDSNILLNHHEFYQRHNLLLYQDEEKIIALVDILDRKILEWLKYSIRCDQIDIKLVRKHDIIKKIQKVFQIELMKFAIHTNENNPYSPSQVNYSSKRSIALISFTVLLFVLLSFQSVFFTVGTITFFNTLYLISTFYKLFLSSLTSKQKQEIIQRGKGFQPIYTILLPLLRENKPIITQLITAIKNINYPQHQLDIKILLEENDNETAQALENIAFDYNFDIIIIPNGEKYKHPQTKARACNYAFNFVKGEYLTIYDGDDIPHPDQLAFSIQKFNEDSEISSIQYLLNSYNFETNLYTKFYSVEFDLWYRIFLPSIQKFDMPITFGGTSNHFRISALKDNIWDAYNLTEDADLGVRWWLNKSGKVYLAGDFTTLEEAPISLFALIRQRSRWTKGFIQTYVAHIKHKFDENDNRKLHFLSFMNLFMLLPIVSNLSFLPNILEFLILKFFHRQPNLLSTLGYTTIILFLISFIFQILPAVLHRRKMKIKIGLSIVLFPIYSIIINVTASYKTVAQLFTKPFHWEKTLHGVDKKNRN